MICEECKKEKPYDAGATRKDGKWICFDCVKPKRGRNPDAFEKLCIGIGREFPDKNPILSSFYLASGDRRTFTNGIVLLTDMPDGHDSGRYPDIRAVPLGSKPLLDDLANPKEEGRIPYPTYRKLVAQALRVKRHKVVIPQEFYRRLKPMLPKGPKGPKGSYPVGYSLTSITREGIRVEDADDYANLLCPGVEGTELLEDREYVFHSGMLYLLQPKRIGLLSGGGAGEALIIESHVKCVEDREVVLVMPWLKAYRHWAKT